MNMAILMNKLIGHKTKMQVAYEKVNVTHGYIHQ